MTRLLLGLGALALLATACESETTGPECQPVSLSTAATRGDTVVLNTGVSYIPVAEGEGDAVEFCDGVLVRYSGMFPDGDVFDRGGVIDPFLGYGQLIPGFEHGLVGMRVGGRRRLIVPPQLGYGAQDRVNPQTGEVVIPANSTLVFDVELLGLAPGDD